MSLEIQSDEPLGLGQRHQPLRSSERPAGWEVRQSWSLHLWWWERDRRNPRMDKRLVGMRPRITFTVFSPWASVVDKQVSFWRPSKERKCDREVGRTLSLLFHLVGQGQVLYSFSSRGKEWTLGTLWQEGGRRWDPAGSQPPAVRS